MTVRKTVGLIGIGLVGTGLVEILQANNYDVIGFARKETKRKELESLGGRAAASVEEVSDDLFTEMMVGLHIVSLSKLPTLPANASFPLKAFASEEQVDYREVDYNSLEFAMEELRKRL